MRENMGLYRGFSGEYGWVYGFYAVFGSVHMIGAPDAHGTMMWYAVIPETVGQFTGLIDKHDKRIFEGDILKDDWGKIFKVIFTTESCSFMVRCEHSTNEYETGNYRIGKAWCDTIRVIGNIHDNPELSEG